MPRAVAFFAILAQMAAQSSDAAAEAARAGQLMAAGRAGEAIPIYRRLAALYPQNANLRLNLSIAEFQAALFREAAEDAQRALKMDPQLAPANLFRGASYLKLGEPESAIAPLEAAVRALPDDRNAMLLLAQSYEGRAVRAREALQTRWAGTAYGLLFAADRLREQHRFGGAFASYRGVLKTAALPEAHAGLAQIYRQTGHADRASAEEALARSATKQPAASEPERAYHDQKKYDALAAQTYDRLRALEPSLEAFVYHARRLSSEGRAREAASEWTKALKLSPQNNEVRDALARALYESRDYESVLGVLDQPHSADENFLRGASLLELDRAPQAEQYLRTALKLDQQLMPAKAALGQALLREGKVSEAIPFLEAAAHDGNDPHPRFELYRAYQLAGQADRAREAFLKYQKSRQKAEEQRREDDGVNLLPP